MFTLRDHVTSKLLALIAKNVTIRDRELLSTDDVFAYPHVISTAVFLEPLNTLCLPAPEVLPDYQFVISELSGFADRNKYSFYFRLYVSLLFIVAESMHNNIGDDIEYYLDMLKSILEESALEIAEPVADFLEYVHEEGNWSIVGRDYWLLVTWLFLKRISSSKDSHQLNTIYASLSSNERKEELAKRLKYRDFDPSEWLALSQRVPLLGTLSHDDFRLILMGARL